MHIVQIFMWTAKLKAWLALHTKDSSIVIALTWGAYLTSSNCFIDADSYKDLCHLQRYLGAREACAHGPWQVFMILDHALGYLDMQDRKGCEHQTLAPDSSKIQNKQKSCAELLHKEWQVSLMYCQHISSRHADWHINFLCLNSLGFKIQLNSDESVVNSSAVSDCKPPHN